MPNVVALASEYMPLRNRAWGVAAVMSGMPLGAIVAPGISMWLLPLYGWRSVYFVGFIPLLMVPVALKWMPESPLRLIAKNRLSELKTSCSSRARWSLCRQTLRLRSTRAPAKRQLSTCSGNTAASVPFSFGWCTS